MAFQATIDKNGLTMSIGWTVPDSQDKFSAIYHMEDDLWEAPEKMDGDRNRPLGLIKDDDDDDDDDDV
ncbi:hypothetical protein ANN_18119 [Periplaneta americana]|uniref:Uncharacterized protein n=1 Tax=Periplaneta americana TaxID=6978 RepID=A0ABQ8SND1_PERAM|nr:hypothetical protein ANN_18119 [Periplaneta americana]